ncbi:SLC13 family permease [Streptomyces sp. WMMB 322]|uniref:SLC13 family permease n=1 Tax=Streptomyces sp. WMMB 322 TaxID=1286821 RepID=UPI0006E2B649|nr:SLC13 family permease [Streptomyces sp. WMMB 322]SCK22450.1 transporter, UIT1 family (TC 9.B.48) [Streptomyces sp. WMMB 322]
MSAELISILVLAVIFVVATTRSVNMGALAFAAAFGVGTLAAGFDSEKVFAGFPGDLFVVLVGVTYFFAIARANGTTDWLVHAGIKAVRGRIVLIPWVMFAVTGVLTAIGAVSPAAVAIVAPIAMGFAAKYRIHPLLMGALVVHGAQAGGFSPISIYGSTVNGIVAREGLPGNELALFAASLVVNLVIAAVIFIACGGMGLRGTRAEDAGPDGSRGPAAGGAPGTGGASGGSGAPAAAGAQAGAVGTAVATQTRERTGPDRSGGAGGVPDGAERLTPARAATLTGLVLLVVAVLGFDLDAGLTAIALAVVLAVIWPADSKKAISGIAWPTVLLVCGMLTYVNVLDEMGTIEWAGEGVAAISLPLVAALLFCYIGGFVSAFASSTGIIGALIPLVVPFLEKGEIGVVGMVAALSVSATVVDVSPFSTNGALVLASAEEVDRDRFFRQLMIYGGVVTAAVPALIWLTMVVPGFG